MVIETPDGNLSKGMRQLNGVYTQRFNRHHRQVGHIFQGRYKAIAIEKESYLAEVIRYVVLNPIRAKAVQDPGQWGWSSYRGTAGLEEPHPCLRREWILGQFDTVQRRAERKYREFVRSGIDKNDLWTEVKGQSILGEDEFVGQLIGHVKGHEDIKEIPRMQRYMGRPSLSELLDGVAPADKNSSESKICKAVMDHAYSLKEVADHLNIHYSTVSRMVSRASHACNKT